MADADNDTQNVNSAKSERRGFLNMVAFLNNVDSALGRCSSQNATTMPMFFLKKIKYLALHRRPI
jgi:hypothetical protein